MGILNYEEMTLESDTFQTARETFNLMMQKLLKKMEQSDMDEGSIELKISIELKEDFVPRENDTTVIIKKPLIKHKISTVVPVKDSANGKQDIGMELVYDTEQSADSDVVSVVPAIEQTGGYFLPDNQVNEQESENDADVPNGDYESTDDSGMPLPFNEGNDDYPYDEPEE